MQLHHRIRGDGYPVIMLHGLFGSLDNLGALARSLEDEYSVVSVDLRNHGRSEHAVEMSYPLLAQDVLELMDEIGIDKAHVFGHSMGGKTAMQLALQAPDQVSKLVVGDIAPVQYQHHHTAILEGMQKVEGAAPDSRKGAEEILAPFTDEPSVLSFLLTNWRKKEDGTWAWRLNLSSIISEYNHIIAGNSGDPYRGPTLFVRGGLSDYIMSDHRDVILSLFPRATVRTVEGTGHWLHAEKPDMVSRIVKRFFSE